MKERMDGRIWNDGGMDGLKRIKMDERRRLLWHGDDDDDDGAKDGWTDCLLRGKRKLSGSKFTALETRLLLKYRRPGCFL